jgi:hypothetical protein
MSRPAVACAISVTRIFARPPASRIGRRHRGSAVASLEEAEERFNLATRGRNGRAASAPLTLADATGDPLAGRTRQPPPGYTE